jgi:hypothetical protein
MFLTFSLMVTARMTAQAQSGTFNDGHGKEWLQLPATAGISWNATAQVCPQDGLTGCSGSIEGRNVNEWVWATDTQVLQLFSYFDQDLATNRSAEGMAHFGTAQSFLSGSTFQPTHSFCITYACGAFAGGWTATIDNTGLPIVGSVGWGTTPVSLNGSFSVVATANADDAQSTRGVWLWRATGPGPHAYDDAGSVASPAGGIALASVFGNDWMNGAGAFSGNVNIYPGSSSHQGITLDLTDGSVAVAPATPAGNYSLTYRICDVADGSTCDDATVFVIVEPYIVTAVNDSGWASPSTGGTALGSVLTNDRLSGTLATMGNLSLSLVSIAPASDGITLDASDGSIDVARGTALGNYVVSYQICDRTNLANCAQASASIVVRNFVINAVNESARISSKTGGTAIANVLANDTLEGLRATTAIVQLSQVSLPIRGITLNLSTGAVSVAPKTASGTYSLVYRICETAGPTNCDEATVTLDLSGGGGR